MLNEIVKSDEDSKNPAEILNELETKVNQALSSKQYHTQSKDGMDIALCCFDLQNNKLTYAGAFRPLIVVKESEIQEIKGDRFPIGGGNSYDKKPFNCHEITINKGDSFFMYSDGFPDQFGGPKSKKYMNKKFKQFLLSQVALSSEKQLENLDKELKNWQGENEQVDDILVMGIFF